MSAKVQFVENKNGTNSVYFPYVFDDKREHVIAKHQSVNGSLIFYNQRNINAVKNAFLRSGFELTRSPADNGEWTTFWGKPLKSAQFREMRPHQIVNHFPGTWALGRKDRLYKNVAARMARFGKDFKIQPDTYTLPMDKLKLENDLCYVDDKSTWIVKPVASSRGRGIHVLSYEELTEMDFQKKILIQRYIDNPYLIQGRKFDMRIYCVVVSFDPLEIYMCQDGLIRFCTGAYDLENLSDTFAHLTNYSLNKKSENFVENEDDGDEEDDSANKWSLKKFWEFMANEGKNVSSLKQKLEDLVLKTFISCESSIVTSVRNDQKYRNSCYEIFGLDVMLDTKMKMWLVEVNISPSMGTAAGLDKRIKTDLLTDTFNMIGFRPNNTTNHHEPFMIMERSFRELENIGSFSPSLEERNLIGHWLDRRYRCGRLVALFPRVGGEKYIRYFSKARYTDTLLNRMMAFYEGGGKIKALPLRTSSTIPFSAVSAASSKSTSGFSSRKKTRRFANTIGSLRNQKGSGRALIVKKATQSGRISSSSVSNSNTDSRSPFESRNSKRNFRKRKSSGNIGSKVKVGSVNNLILPLRSQSCPPTKSDEDDQSTGSIGSYSRRLSKRIVQSPIDSADLISTPASNWQGGFNRMRSESPIVRKSAARGLIPKPFIPPAPTAPPPVHLKRRVSRKRSNTHNINNPTFSMQVSPTTMVSTPPPSLSSITKNDTGHGGQYDDEFNHETFFNPPNVPSPYSVSPNPSQQPPTRLRPRPAPAALSRDRLIRALKPTIPTGEPSIRTGKKTKVPRQMIWDKVGMSRSALLGKRDALTTRRHFKNTMKSPPRPPQDIN
eukprot:TRINITY_DN23327_c0_g1_i1.p1 TRINITY_DN23327_c0_g1~~TRINITY_DN23327_c0_g1_i1.p1  ORF type:complete len:834 (+),score=164.25 TRINITY_DN23327_c0_g1_i1:175-2676(+)